MQIQDIDWSKAKLNIDALVKKYGANPKKVHEPISEIVYVKTTDKIKETIHRHIDNIHSIGTRTSDEREIFLLLDEENKNFVDNLASLAKDDPVVYPFDVFGEDDIFPAIERSAAKRYTLPKIPISYFYDVIQGEKVFTPSYVEWQTNDNKRKNFVVTCNNDYCKEIGIDIINQMVLSILLAFPIKKVHVNVIDLDNTLDFNELFSKFDRKLVTVISTTLELNELIKRFELLTKNHISTPGFKNAEEYYETRQDITTQYELVIIANYNGNSFRLIENSLIKYFQYGRTSGIYFFVLNVTIPKPADNYSSKNLFLEQENFYTEINTENLTVDAKYRQEALTNLLSFYKDNKLQDQALRYINAAVYKKPDLSMDWDNLINTPYLENVSEIIAPIGFLENGEGVDFRINSTGIYNHALIVGPSGTGKTRLLSSIILSMTIRYQPEDLELYLLDFKGTEFNCYKNLNHSRTILVNGNDQLMVYKIFEDIYLEKKKRVSMGVQNIDAYNRKNASGRLSHIVVIADECHEIFNSNGKKDGKLLDETINIIEDIARQGRSFGIHLLFATQTLKGISNLSNRSGIMSQITDCYFLQNTSADVASIISDAHINSKVEKLERGTGQCMYYSKSISDNSQKHFIFTFNYIDPENGMQDRLVQSSFDKAIKHKSNGKVYIDGEYKYILNRNVINQTLNKFLDCISMSPGVEISLKQLPISLSFKTNSKENLLLVGSNTHHEVTRVTIITLLSLLLKNKQLENKYRIVVVDCLLEVNSDYFNLLNHLKEQKLIDCCERGNMPSYMKQLCSDIASNNVQPTILVIIGQQKFEELDPDFENNNMDPMTRAKYKYLSGTQNENVAQVGVRNANDAFNFILEKGPMRNVHTIMQLDSISNYLFMKNLIIKSMVVNKFKHLILLRSDNKTSDVLGPIKVHFETGNRETSMDLDNLDNSEDNLRACYYNEENDNNYQFFSPFILPSIENINELINK